MFLWGRLPWNVAEAGPQLRLTPTGHSPWSAAVSRLDAGGQAGMPPAGTWSV